MRGLESVLIMTLSLMVANGQSCDPTKAGDCVVEFIKIFGLETDEICKIRDSALSELETCVANSNCSSAEYVDGNKEQAASYDDYCHPGCEGYQGKVERLGQCPQLAEDIANTPREICKIIQTMSDCAHTEIDGCPILEQAFKNSTLQSLAPYATACNLTYGSEPVKGDDTCGGIYYKTYLCHPDNYQDIASIFLGESVTNDLCNSMTPDGLAEYKKCLLAVEVQTPECFYPISTTDSSEVNGKYPAVSEYIDIIPSACSEDCEDIQQAYIDVTKCLPAPSFEVSSALELPSLAKCQVIEDWIKVGTDCAQDLVGKCQLLEHTFNQQGVDGLVEISQVQDINEKFQKAQEICKIETQLTAEKDDNVQETFSKATFSFTLKADYDTIVKIKSKFKASVVEQLAEILKVDKSRFINVDIVKGSIIVKFDLLKDPDDKPVEDVAEQLKNLVENEALLIKDDNGNVLPVDPNSYKAVYDKDSSSKLPIALGVTLPVVFIITIAVIIVCCHRRNTRKPYKQRPPMGYYQGYPPRQPMGYPQMNQQGYPQMMQYGYPQMMQQGYPQSMQQGYSKRQESRSPRSFQEGNHYMYM